MADKICPFLDPNVPGSTQHCRKDGCQLWNLEFGGQCSLAMIATMLGMLNSTITRIEQTR